MLLDVKTAYFLIGFFYIVMPASAYFYLGNHNTTQVKLWFLGGFLNGVGLLLIGLRPQFPATVPEFYSYTLLNVLLVTGYVIRIQSLLIEIKRKLPIFLLIGFVLIFALIYQLCIVFGESIQPRVLFALFVTALLLLSLAAVAKSYVDYFSLKSMAYISFFYGLLGITISVKLVLLILGYESYNVLENSPINSLMIVIGMLAVIYSNLGYIAVVMGRVEQNYQTESPLTL